MSKVNLEKIIDFGPTRPLSKNAVARFVEMAALKSNQRKIDSPEVFKSFSGGAKFKNGDTLFARITPCMENGKTSYVDFLKGSDIGFGSTEFIVMASKSGVHKFAYYVATSPDFRKFAQQHMDGTSGRQRVNAKDLKKYQIINFSKIEQQAIATILSSFDDKIELNNAMNKTLEEMAQTLFHSWFVEFDIVKAKKAGKKIEGFSQEIIDLFPDDFEDVEGFGLVPCGWGVEKIGDVIKRVPSGIKYSQKNVFTNGAVPVIDQGKSALIGFHNDSPGVNASIENPIIVFANHTCYMNIFHYPFSTIQNVLPFVGKRRPIYWTYFATRDKIKFSEYKGHFPDFCSRRVIVPSLKISEKYDVIVKNMMIKSHENIQENERLAQTRDALLSKLISGEMRVKDAEKFLARMEGIKNDTSQEVPNPSV